MNPPDLSACRVNARSVAPFIDIGSGWAPLLLPPSCGAVRGRALGGSRQACASSLSNTAAYDLTMFHHPFNFSIAACTPYCSSHPSCDTDTMDATRDATQSAQQDAHSDTHTAADQDLDQTLHQHNATDDDEDDRDSAMGSDGFPSETGTIAPEVTNYRWEYGRRWASESWPPNEHYFPNDDNEMYRYGLTNDLIYLALGRRHYTAPLDQRNVHHVLDVGCGTPVRLRCSNPSNIYQARATGLSTWPTAMAACKYTVWTFSPYNPPMSR